MKIALIMNLSTQEAEEEALQVRQLLEYEGHQVWTTRKPSLYPALPHHIDWDIVLAYIDDPEDIAAAQEAGDMLHPIDRYSIGKFTPLNFVAFRNIQEVVEELAR